MEVKVKLQTITITDMDSGDSFTINTIRSAADIADFIRESERDEIASRLEEEVWHVLNQE